MDNLLVLNEPLVLKKLARLEDSVHRCLTHQSVEAVPEFSAREMMILGPKQLPPKLGLATKAGQARLMHDLASIELQAMELGLRSLMEYPEAPHEFREAMANLVINESEHLKLCLHAIEENGGKWGDYPVHLTLWNAVSKEDSLLDRILIVHLYLEGSGLDAGDTILRRLDGMPKTISYHVMKTIRDEEVGHVQFGVSWYREFCRQARLDPDKDFKERITAIGERLPKRLEPISRELRVKSGFTDDQIAFLEERRSKFLLPKPKISTDPLVGRPV